MRNSNLLKALLLATPLLFPPSAYAAVGAPAAPQTLQVRAAGEHAEHGEHAGDGAAAHKDGTVRGAGKPTVWTIFPTLKTKMSGEGRERRLITVIPQGIVAGSFDAYSNDVEDPNGHRQLPLDKAGAKLDKPKSGGFHWLAAREEQAGQVRVASTVYFFSDRGNHNPTAMFMRQKHELEIIPQPYPREHSRYRANEDWKFLVRFNGKPLASQKVFVETANGSKAELASDALGMITVRIPGDFKAETQQKAAEAHDHGRRSADFVLATEHEEGGKTYLTAFNASYGTDAFDQRSLAMGLGFTLLGMIGAVPLLRQRKNAKQEADVYPAATDTAKSEDA